MVNYFFRCDNGIKTRHLKYSPYLLRISTKVFKGELIIMCLLKNKMRGKRWMVRVLMKQNCHELIIEAGDEDSC